MQTERFNEKQWDTIEEVIIYMYKALTTKNYLTDSQLTRLVTDAENKFESLQKESIFLWLLSLTNTIKGLLSLGIRYQTIHAFERRFSYVFSLLIQDCIEKLPHLVDSSTTEKEQFSKTLIELYLEDLENPDTPWEPLLFHWMLLMKDTDTLEHYLNLFTQKEKQLQHYSLALITSLLALKRQEGAKSLQYLKKHKEKLKPNDLFYHFLFLKQEEDWDGIKAWLDMFFPTQKKEQLGLLTSFYETAIIHLSGVEESFFYVWDKWLERPSFQTYLRHINKLSKEEQQKSLDYILPKLKEDLYIDGIHRVYFQIIAREKMEKEGIDFLLQFEHQPLQLSDEKKQFLQTLEQEKGEVLIPLYHQFIVRLIEKKSRQHYEEAVKYMKRLENLYKKENQLHVFQNYLIKMKEKYKTYRALLQEMKRFELFAQSK